MLISKDLIDRFLEKQSDKKQVVFHILFDVFCLILTKICDRNINITCLFIVLVFEEKVNEILTYNGIIVQLILYYYYERSAKRGASSDSRAVFFVRCHHSINFAFDRHRYPSVPPTARGTCRGESVGDTLSIGNSTIAGPIAFKFGVC